MVELIAKRYGTALFELAKETDKVEEIKDQLLELQKVLNNETELQELLGHPKVVLEKKIQIIENVFEEVLDKDVLGLIVITIKKGRQNQLSDIIAYCLHLVEEYAGIVRAKVTSPVELSEEQLNKVKDKLENLTNKTVELDLAIDPSLIAGLTIRIGDRIIDSSIKGKIQNMAKSL